MTICPCCGFKDVESLTAGCEQCGARAVGEALPKPAHELPSYGRSLILVVSGSLLVLVFLIQTILAMVQRASDSISRVFQLWSWIAAGETAAWRLKWISFPVMFVTLWFGVKIYRSIKLQPERFCGLKYARRGLMASAMVAILIATLIESQFPPDCDNDAWQLKLDISPKRMRSRLLWSDTRICTSACLINQRLWRNFQVCQTPME